MKSAITKRSVVLGGHKTSVSLEDQFWNALKEIATGRHMTVASLVNEINVGREHSNLSSALRLFVLQFYRDRIADRTRQMEKVA